MKLPDQKTLVVGRKGRGSEGKRERSIDSHLYTQIQINISMEYNIRNGEMIFRYCKLPWV